ncbi:MAG: hypothetical protein LBS58_03970, partial [Coriobacteriales bacterium]|nr:hypothetical protein [Coriobacteriales bacterium]
MRRRTAAYIAVVLAALMAVTMIGGCKMRDPNARPDAERHMQEYLKEKYGQVEYVQLGFYTKGFEWNYD